MGQQVLRVALEHVADGNFLVPGLAEEADDGLRLGERAVALADFEPFLALLDGRGAVRRVHDRDRAFGPCGPVLAQHREREAVERAAVDAADAVAEQIRFLSEYPQTLCLHILPPFSSMQIFYSQTYLQTENVGNLTKIPHRRISFPRFNTFDYTKTQARIIRQILLSQSKQIAPLLYNLKIHSAIYCPFGQKYSKFFNQTNISAKFCTLTH